MTTAQEHTPQHEQGSARARSPADHVQGHDHDHDRDHGHDHDHDHDHDHGHAGHGPAHHHHHHGHAHAPKDFGKAFAIGVALNGGFVVAEAFYGWRSDSLALIADAGHNLGDVLGLVLAWTASVLVKRAPTRRFTYGLRSTSILAALANAALLMFVTGGIAWEAVMRLREPPPVAAMTVVIVAAVGVAINLGTALMFMSGREHDLNVRATFLHMAADAALSLGVVIAGFVIMRTGWLWLDPLVSFAIALFMIWATWGLLRDSVGLALQGVPGAVDAHAVRRYLESVDGVARVHDLHIWGMSTTENALTAHLVFPQGFPGDTRLREISVVLREHHGIAHATIQVETVDSGNSCVLGTDAAA
jgi:cobalt-zinc-cadmium efflux system protein